MGTFFKALERAEQELAERRSMRSMTVPAPPADRGPAFSTASHPGLEQLKLLLDYTKFQIGLYTLLALVFAFPIAFQPSVFKVHRGLLGLAVVCVCLAGMAAGIIGSRCAHFTSSRALWAAKIGPFRTSWLQGEHWSDVQHACFGVALGAAVMSVFLGSATWPQSAGSAWTALGYVASCWKHWPPACPSP